MLLAGRTRYAFGNFLRYASWSITTISSNYYLVLMQSLTKIAAASIINLSLLLYFSQSISLAFAYKDSILDRFFFASHACPDADDEAGNQANQKSCNDSHDQSPFINLSCQIGSVGLEPTIDVISIHFYIGLGYHPR